MTATHATSQLLQHIASGHDADSAIELLQTLEDAEDLSTMCWAASGLEQQLFSLTEELPMNTAPVLIQRFGSLPGRGSPMPGACREVAMPLLRGLTELVQARSEDHKILRATIIEEADSGDLFWLQAWLDLVSVPPTVSKGGRPLEPSLDDPHVGSGALNYACQVLALIARGDEEVVSALHKVNVLSAVGARLLQGTQAKPDEQVTAWFPFATSAVLLIDALVGEEDLDRHTISNPSLFIPVWTRYHRPEDAAKGCLAALERSLQQEAFTGASQLQISALRALRHLARLSEAQATRIVRSRAPEWGLQVLQLAGLDEEATVAALEFLLEVSRRDLRLVPVVAGEAAKAASEKLPRSEEVANLAAKVMAATKKGY
eukprot:CAMPEP_0197661690 /NCGR_PEP_ID=MMETSP1338-20131121/51604_1 /TAXON_ID=43686 ORGANISM="Pelagodinium beii, Strain RCC1491" /NCGR_SAMPLE_ID=MMETSP1338 /ASSEMBLY_ACC=CAM_ASM_000754 /LENGTH=373 /DNA_ID=CAMNT_0043239289 /DNA_START=39 /DNA_END=1160 /DNA_ORIENTATION=+